MVRNFRIIFSALLACNPSLSWLLAFDTPLSDTSVRQAYFLGQRHDETLDRFLMKYTLFPEKPQSGPHIQAISFMTPYALIAQYSSERVGNYSAPQAQVDHNKQPEFVLVIVQINLTESYGRYLATPPNSHSAPSLRPADFWKDFRVRVFDEDKLLTPLSAQGQPSSQCDGPEGCVLIGAVIKFEYPAAAFQGKKALVQVEPPEGQPVVAEFDIASLQ